MADPFIAIMISFFAIQFVLVKLLISFDCSPAFEFLILFSVLIIIPVQLSLGINMIEATNELGIYDDIAKILGVSYWASISLLILISITYIAFFFFEPLKFFQQ